MTANAAPAPPTPGRRKRRRSRGAHRIIRWAPAHPDADKIVWIDVVIFDRRWRRDPGYIRRGAQGDDLGSRYEGFGRWLRAERWRPVWMPEIGLAAGGTPDFTDGRHRFAWLRDRGVAALPVAVEPHQAWAVARLYGTRRRVTRLSSRAAMRRIRGCAPAIARRKLRGPPQTLEEWLAGARVIAAPPP